MAKKSIVRKSRRSDSNVPMTKREIISTLARKKTNAAARGASKKTVKNSKKAGKKSKRG